MINSQMLLIIIISTLFITTLSMGMLGQPLMGLYIGLYIDIGFIVLWIVLKLFSRWKK
jgi:hypothetical protein